MDRQTVDKLVSTTAVLVATVMIILGGLAVFGGTFAQNNVSDLLEPQKVVFPPAEAMSPEETAEVGDYAGQTVTTGNQAEGFSRYIGLHLEEVNDGATYSETSSAARAEGLDPDAAAELQGAADTLFKGEALRTMLLTAYAWWTVATIAIWAGAVLLIGGALLGILAALGFRHAKKVAEREATTVVAVPEPATV